MAVYWTSESSSWIAWPSGFHKRVNWARSAVLVRIWTSRSIKPFTAATFSRGDVAHLQLFSEGRTVFDPPPAVIFTKNERTPLKNFR